jgi:hypothetical protein
MGWDGKEVEALIRECAELDREFELAAERPSPSNVPQQ